MTSLRRFFYSAHFHKRLQTGRYTVLRFIREQAMALIEGARLKVVKAEAPGGLFALLTFESNWTVCGWNFHGRKPA